MSIPSIKSRFIVSFFSNLFRGGLSFATGLLIARGLGPENYGNFVFLLGSFMALRQLLDMGTSNAFFTIVSKKPCGIKFLAAYGMWQLFQLCLPLVFIGFIFPDSFREMIWLGHDRGLIVMAFVAVFMREQAWTTMVRIGESARLTYRVQLFNFSITAIHFLIIVGIWWFDFLSVNVLFSLIILEYLMAITVAMKVFDVHEREDLPLDWKGMIKEYRSFCSPLVLLSIVGFAYEFSDRWLLQNFGGAREQGFYGISFQFSVIALLATTSLFQIFWKEIAEAQEKNDLERVRFLYKKVSRFLFTISAVMCGFLMPWSEVIVKLTLGDAYLEGAPALAVMFLYPVHQSMGRITETLLMATSQTGSIVFMRCIIMAITPLVTYFILAPSEALVPGLGMGSLGMALKMVIMQIISINLFVWRVDKKNGWEFDWTYQLVAIGVALPLGFLAYAVAGEIIMALSLNIYWKMGFAFSIYSALISIFMWWFPGVAGMTQIEIKALRQAIFNNKL